MDVALSGPAPNFRTPVGWQCPACGHVYSPTIPMCVHCGAEEVKPFTTTSSPSAKPYRGTEQYFW